MAYDFFYYLEHKVIYNNLRNLFRASLTLKYTACVLALSIVCLGCTRAGPMERLGESLDSAAENIVDADEEVSDIINPNSGTVSDDYQDRY